MLALFFQDLKLFILLQHKALKGKRRFCPWPIELGDKQPEGQLFNRNFPKFHADELVSISRV